MKKVIRTVKYYDDGTYDEIIHHITSTASYYTTCPTCYFTTFRSGHCFNNNCPSNGQYYSNPCWRGPYMYDVTYPYYTGDKK